MIIFGMFHFIGLKTKGGGGRKKNKLKCIMKYSGTDIFTMKWTEISIDIHDKSNLDNHARLSIFA